MNEYRGEVAIMLSGKAHTLRFTWSAIMELRREYGADFDQRVAEAIASIDLDALASVVAIGLRHEWQDANAAAVVKASPSIAEATTAVQHALRLAFHGPGEVTDKPPENPLRAAASRLKQILYRLATFLRWQPA